MIYTVEQAPIEEVILSSGVLKRKQGQRKKAHGRELINLVTAFDIETSTIHLQPVPGQKHNDRAFMYIWQFQLGLEYTIIGRTWDEFKRLCERVQAACEEIKQKKKFEQKPLLVVYVHNLAFEFQFLSGVYDFEDDECFFRQPRKPIYCRMYNSLEFRCSYLLTNMSLDKFVKKMGCKNKKMVGDLDYSRMRYPWTPLDADELKYCINDVLALVEAIYILMERDGDDLRSIPLTSTGYVRRDCKKSLLPYRHQVEDMLPDEAQYRLLRKAFRGGNTHANRGYVGQIVEDVYSMDMASCYPAQQLTKKFPMKPFKWLDPCEPDRVFRFIGLDYAVVMTCVFKNLQIKNPKEPIPYVSLSKTESVDFVVDNGRLLFAAYSRMSVTEIDLEIILRQYTFDGFTITEAMVAEKDFLPDTYRQTIREYYQKKTDLKNVDGMDYEYMKSKNKLNGIYGMTAQDPVHQEILYHGGEYKVSDYDSGDVAKRLKRANFPYQWGVYTTAYARAALQDGIDAAGANMVYGDTDSVKTRGKVDFSAINKQRQKLARKMGAYAKDRHGITHYMGVYEQDATYTRYITQGAKRYAYEYLDRAGNVQMGITVAGVGVNKDPASGKPVSVLELGKLENFRPGFIWQAAGGTAAVYNDKDDFDYIAENGRPVHISKNVAIVQSTYDLEYADDYSRLLRNLDTWQKFCKRSE